MKRYKVNTPIQHGSKNAAGPVVSKRYEIGEEIVLDENEAAQLLEVGAITPLRGLLGS